MIYPSQTFTEAERARLSAHFTNLDKPVFALINLPETVKGALFARYSRYPGTLRRLFLDEFADNLPEISAEWDSSEGQRAAQLYERVFVGFGDDSIAQLGGAHVACEWVSNIVTKILQRPRLGAYLEQSTRYIAYDSPLPSGGYRYYRDSQLGAQYEKSMDQLFDFYSTALPKVIDWAQSEFPPENNQSEVAYRRAIKAKALDLLRGVLPTASLSHMGIFATGQTYEQLIMHLLAHELPEARNYGEMILSELKAVMPSFVARIDRPDRGGQWIEYIRQRNRSEEKLINQLGLTKTQVDNGPSVRLLSVNGDEVDLLCALLFEHSGQSETQIRAAIDQLDSHQRVKLLTHLIGDRKNRRYRPGRGFERVSYRFEIVSDYGAFRDLQRHRLLTIQWQHLTPTLGAAIPDELTQARVADGFNQALEISAQEYDRIVELGHIQAAPYALCLAYRIRYILDLNARAAMHLIELRSGREGHPSYRAIAHAMHAEIARVHPQIAAAMVHVDRQSEPRLERILAELRIDARRSRIHT